MTRLEWFLRIIISSKEQGSASVAQTFSLSSLRIQDFSDQCGQGRFLLRHANLLSF